MYRNNIRPKGTAITRVKKNSSPEVHHVYVYLVYVHNIIHSICVVRICTCCLLGYGPDGSLKEAFTSFALKRASFVRFSHEFFFVSQSTRKRNREIIFD